MGVGAHEMVLDGEGRFRCRNNSGGIYELTGFALAYPTWKSATK